MEDIYFPVSDCIHNLSKLFTFFPLLKLSSSSRYNSKFIYELHNHDSVDQPIYYTSTNQIKLFHNLHTLIIPQYYSYCNLSTLTHIYNVRCANPYFFDNILCMTQLTSCVCVHSLRDVNGFHTNLRNLYDYCIDDYDSKSIYNFNDIISFTHLTGIDTVRLNEFNDITQLFVFSNLKSLKTDVFKNISELSNLKYLNKLTFLFDNVNALESILISHSNLTRIIITNVKYCSLINCYNLKYLKLCDYETFKIDNTSKLQTLILDSGCENNLKDFDISSCVNLEYFQYDDDILISDLTKLNSLSFKCVDHINVDQVTSNNLTFLNIYCPEKETIFDLINYTNLIKLSLSSALYRNIDMLVKLEYLSLTFAQTQNADQINCFHHLNLTYLQNMNVKVVNLFALTKLKSLTLSGLNNVSFFWDHDIQYLSLLTCLNLSLRIDSVHGLYSNRTFDARYLSRCVDLKYFICGFFLNELNVSKNIKHLYIPYAETYYDTLLSLTKLTYLCLVSDKNFVPVDLRNLKRLNNVSDERMLYPEVQEIE